MTIDIIHLTTCQAPIAEPFAQEVVAYIAGKLQLNLHFVADISWPERLRAFDAGEIQVCWLCGVPYVWRADEPQPQIELLAAPVPAGSRYQNRPIYFSDVVVRADSPFHTFSDLQGRRWAINERNSHSGYHVTRYHLAQLNLQENFFGRVIESGAHQNSVQMILAEEIDGTAIDSTVLELMVEREPTLRSQLRVIEVFGPSPVPPWVIKKSVTPELQATLRKVLTTMHEDSEGAAVLAVGQVCRFAEVQDRDYDPIRHMLRESQHVTL